jgi:prepilin-type N-terminal cleavage/methylation domain-containing protein
MLKKLHNKKGFTLAELLIVVAIIAVLVAISIPIFNSQLEKARRATTEANLRSAYAEVSAELIDADVTSTGDVDVSGVTNGSGTATVANVDIETTTLTDSKLPFDVTLTKTGKQTITFTVTNDKITAAAGATK